MFSNQFTVEEIIEYIKKARAFRLSDNDYCNLLKRKEAAISEYIQKRTELPLLNKRLTDSKIKSFFNTKKAQIVGPGK